LKQLEVAAEAHEEVYELGVGVLEQRDAGVVAQEILAQHCDLAREDDESSYQRLQPADSLRFRGHGGCKVERIASPFLCVECVLLL
jgi:hypothetical protein